ncbi:MAG TPA: DUF749 family protein [Methanomassiliicoccales archaeon]|nr:DUF749 family protein [Methanomassiliicoccales archaeon]
MYKAHLIGVYNHGELPEELTGFVRFAAHRLNHTPIKEEKVAILQIVGTTSYFPIFLKKVDDLEQIDVQLKEVEAVMDDITRLSMGRVLQEKNK